MSPSRILHTRLDPDTWAWLEKQAAQREITLSDFVRQILARAQKGMP